MKQTTLELARQARPVMPNRKTFLEAAAFVEGVASKSGGELESEALQKVHAWFAWYIVRQAQHYAALSGEDTEDMVQEGMLGLYKVLRYLSHNPNVDVDLDAFGRAWINKQTGVAAGVPYSRKFSSPSLYRGPVRLIVSHSRGHARRSGTNARTSGSRRSAAGSSSSSSDPGDGGDSDPPGSTAQPRRKIQSQTHGVAS